MEELDQRRRDLRRSVVLTFPLAFAIHDVEETLTAARWSETAVARLGGRRPRLARALAGLFPISAKEMSIAVGVPAAGVAGVTAHSLRHLDGDLRALQAALAAFSLHSASHVGASIVFRGYTPGIATVPIVIVPYTLWAWRRLRRAAVATRPADVSRAARAGLIFAWPLALGGHAVARLIVRRPGR